MNNLRKSNMNRLKTLFGIMLILLIGFGCDNNDSSSQSNVIKANYTFVKEAFPGKVTFINTSENADSYTWDFGDGTFSTLENPLKTFTETGDFQVKLTVKNEQTGNTDSFTSIISIYVFQGGLVTNGNFQNGISPWTFGVVNPISPSHLVTENGNTYFSINVPVAGNPFDVNLSQVGINMTEGTTYRLTFDAWSDINRSIIAGIGLSGNPWTNQSISQNLTNNIQNFSIDLVANFSSTNGRIIFDLGAAVGKVNIDNVTLNIVP